MDNYIHLTGLLDNVINMPMKTTLMVPRVNTRAGSLADYRVLISDRLRIAVSASLQRYANWRIMPTAGERSIYRNSPSIVLTFDDYGDELQIRSLLLILKVENIRGVFFLQGDWANNNDALVELIRTNGHYIGNHTYSHPDLMLLSDDEVRSQILHGPKSALVRPPMGRYNQRIRNICAESGKSIAYWTIDSDDWRGASPTYMRRKIIHQLHPGAVILFHIHAANTVTVLPNLIREIRALGYGFMSFNEPFMETTDVTR